MSTHTDYLATGTNGARRIHRATCKRAKRPVALADLRPADLAGATPASCCKPSATKVGQALLALSTEREAARPAVRGTKRQDWTADEEDAGVVVPFTDSGLAKHYWRIACRHGATTLADALGLRVRTTATTATLTGEGAEEAADILRSMWTEGAERFAEWRTTDAEYLAIKAADKGLPWGKSAKKDAELAWLQDWVERTVQEVGEGR